MEKLGSITIEIIIGFIALFLITKFIGKRQITPLAPFDNGQITVLNKYKYGTPKREDLNLEQQEITLSTPLISDGQLLKENLEKHNLEQK